MIWIVIQLFGVNIVVGGPMMSFDVCKRVVDEVMVEEKIMPPGKTFRGHYLTMDDFKGLCIESDIPPRTSTGDIEWAS